jgi:hypothetical protein
VTVRLAFALAAVTLLAVVVYLFVEVRSAPASPQAGDPGRATARPSPVAISEPPPAPSAPVGSAPAPAPAPVRPALGRPEFTGIQHLQLAGSDSGDIVADDGRTVMKLDQVMDQANKAYDHQEFDDARALAGKVLAKQPNNIRMLRVMTSSYCMEGDGITAQKYYALLPKLDREQMKVRCAEKSGITFTDPP